MVLGSTVKLEFQDRCLQPLNQPREFSPSSVRRVIAAGPVRSNFEAKLLILAFFGNQVSLATNPASFSEILRKEVKPPALETLSLSSLGSKRERLRPSHERGSTTALRRSYVRFVHGGCLMSQGPQKLKASDVAKALRGAMKAGFKVLRAEIGADGRIVLDFTEQQNPVERVNEWDSVT
jgi:hypothetical protein